MVSAKDETFTYRRKVRYGDCDASCNYYTPRALDYAVEALAAWYESYLGVCWSELVTRSGWEVAFLKVGCEYPRTLTAGETVRLRVTVAGFDDRRIRFTVSGSNDAGALCIVAHLTASFVELRTLDPVPMPERCRYLIERYRNCCSQGDPASEPPQTTLGDFLPFASSPGRNEAPYLLQRRVTYGECTASGTLYPAHLFDYLLEATGGWYEKHLGISWLQQNRQKIGNPFLNVTCEYLKPIVAGQLISTTVAVRKLGNSSISYAVAGYDEKGNPCFKAQLTACYTVEENGALKPTPFPDRMREKITAYQAACDPLRIGTA